MKGRYQVESYSWDKLVALFSIGANNADQSFVGGKPQVAYIDEYCSSANVNTLVLETPYIDKHYSEDYGGYYVKCHADYPKTCARLHFFQKTLPKSQIDNFLTGKKTDLDLNEAGYCGFVVIKPLPETIIGRTCLKPLPVACGTIDGSFFLTQDGYTPNLFGVDIPVAALPFQEQDHEVGACATSAMWTALHGTANVFDTPILSPLSITKRAFTRRPIPGVSLPSNGLDIDQLAAVLHDVGLEADQNSAREKYLLQTIATAYLRAHIPVILTINFGTPKNPELHGITLTGVGPMDGKVVPFDDSGFLLRATRINRFYAHDDGVGPYSELTLDPKSHKVVTGWVDDNGKPIKASPEALLIPVYHKLRVLLPDLLESIVHFDWLVENNRAQYGLPLPERIEWDVFLTRASDYKKAIVAGPPMPGSMRKELLVSGLPHFFWRATAYAKGAPLFELLIDSSDLRQGRQLTTVIIYDNGIISALSRLCRDLADAVDHAPKLTRTILKELGKIGP